MCHGRRCRFVIIDLDSLAIKELFLLFLQLHYQFPSFKLGIEIVTEEIDPFSSVQFNWVPKELRKKSIPASIQKNNSSQSHLFTLNAISHQK